MCGSGLLIIGCHFIVGKIKLTAFFPVRKKLPELNIIYSNNRIRQFHIEFLGCYLDPNLSGESMAMKFLQKINAKL